MVSKSRHSVCAGFEMSKDRLSEMG